MSNCYNEAKHVKIPGVFYSVRPTNENENEKVYWGPYHTLAEAQAVRDALTLKFSHDRGDSAQRAEYVDPRSMYQIHYEERDEFYG